MTPTPWEDDRLDAAFGALATAHPVPGGLVAATRSTLRAPRPSRFAWRGMATSTALVVATVAVIGGVILGYGALRATAPSGASSITVIEGPSPDLRTLDAGEFRFDFPADWHADPAGPVGGGGGSPVAILGNERLDPPCRAGDGVDMDCVYQQPLAPGAIRVVVATESIRGGTIFDREDIENGTTTRPSIGSMPAVQDTFDYALDSFYREDASRRWTIAMPGSLGRAVTIELMAREWPTAGSGTTKTAIEGISQVLIDSFRFTPPPAPLPTDPAAGVAAGHAALQATAASFREAYVPASDSQSIYFDCLAPEPEVLSDADVRFGPGGDLGGRVHLECYWSITAESPAIWRLDSTFRWTVGRTQSVYVETRWLDASGIEIGSTFRGEPPPIVGPVATEPPGSPGTTEPPGTPMPSDAPSLVLPVIGVGDAIAVRDSGVDDREIAVRGWFTDGLTAACMGRSGQIVVHPLQMTCEDRQTWLMQDPEVLAFPGTSSALPGPPAGPALNPDFDGLDRGWIPQLSAETPMPLTEVVLLGHFDDRRSATCPTTSVTACQDRFVVDRVQSVNGVEQPISDQAPDPALAVPSSDDIQRLVDSIVPDGQVLSILTIRLRDLPRQEPSIEISAGPASPAASDEPISPSKLGDLPGPIVVSIARVLEAGRVVTYVEQAQTGVWRIADDGSTVLVVGVSN